MAMTLEDYLFENRNRAYGAYDLRHSYGKFAFRATIIGVSLFSAGLFTPVLMGMIKPAEKSYKLTVLPKPTPIEAPEEAKDIPLPEPPPQQEAPVLNTYQTLPPEIVPNEDVPEDVFIATQDQLKQHQAGQQTILDGVDLPTAIELSDGKGPKKENIVEVKPTEKDDLPIVNVEIHPEYPGGADAMAKFLRDNLRYPPQAQQAGIAGKVYLSFVVDKDGSISSVEIQKGIGFGCDEEAMRVLRKMPRWKPGRQQNMAVKCRFNLPIAFQLE